MIFYLSKQGQKTILLSSSAPVIFYLILCLVNRFSNIMTIIFIIKLYKIDSFIRIRSRLFQVISFSYYSKHTTTVCHDLSVFLCGSCVEYIVTFFFFECIKSFDREAFLIKYRIPVRCQTTHTAALSSNSRSI